MSPIELNMKKNQQPILPGKQQVTNGKQNYKEQGGEGEIQLKEKKTTNTTKLCQLKDIIRRKKTLVRIMVGGCQDIPWGSSKTLSGITLVLTIQPSCLYSAEYLQLTSLPAKGDLFLASPIQ